MKWVDLHRPLQSSTSGSPEMPGGHFLQSTLLEPVERSVKVRNLAHPVGRHGAVV